MLRFSNSYGGIEVRLSARIFFGTVALGAALCALGLEVSSAEVKNFPDWEGQWKPGSPVLVWDPTKPFGAGQQAPLTPEYQAVFAANRTKATAGGHFDNTRTCGPGGMPRVMTL